VALCLLDGTEQLGLAMLVHIRKHLRCTHGVLSSYTAVLTVNTVCVLLYIRSYGLCTYGLCTYGLCIAVHTVKHFVYIRSNGVCTYGCVLLYIRSYGLCIYGHTVCVHTVVYCCT
jgi:hypothetical protein